MSDTESYKYEDNPYNNRGAAFQQNENNIFRKPLQKIIHNTDEFVEYFDKLHTAFNKIDLLDLRAALSDLLNITNNYICEKTNDFENYFVASHLMEIAFTYDSDFAPQDNQIALQIIQNFLEIRKMNYAPDFLDLDLIPQIIGYFRLQKKPNTLCLEVFKSIIYYSEQSANALLGEINYLEIIEAYKECNPNILHILIQTFEILPFDNQPDEDFNALYDVCTNFLMRVFPKLQSSTSEEDVFIDEKSNIGYGFDSLFHLYNNMCTNPERCDRIWKGYHFLDIINLALKKADINATNSALSLITHMVSIVGEDFPVVDFNSLMMLCEHSDNSIVKAAFIFLNAALRNSRSYYDYFRMCCIMKYLIKFWDESYFTIKEIIHEFICVYITNADKEDKNKCMGMGVIKLIVEGMTFEKEYNIELAIDTIMSIDDYIMPAEYNIPFKRLNLQCAGISNIYHDLLDNDDLSDECHEKLTFFAENDETMRFLLENDDPTIDSDTSDE